MMEPFIHFLSNHWILTSLFIIIILLLLTLEFMNNLKGVPQISPQEATRAINHQQALVLDVRSTERFNEGHIIDAINIPSADIDKQHDKLKSHVAKPIIVVCDSGQSSSKIAILLKKQGFTLAASLKGGLKAWRENQLPMVKK